MRPEYLYHFDEELNIVGYYKPTGKRIIQDDYFCFYEDDYQADEYEEIR